MPFVRGRGFDALDLTLLRNSNATRCTESCRRRQGDQRWQPSQVLSDGGQNKLILGTTRATQSQPPEPQDALEVCEPNLDLLALSSRLLEALGASERPGDVAGVLMCSSATALSPSDALGRCRLTAGQFSGDAVRFCRADSGRGA